MTIKIDIQKASIFLKELSKLEDKYGIYIGSDYEEEIDYTYDEESYVSGVNSFLTISDKDGNEIPLDVVYDRFCCCHNCGEEAIEGDNFCSEKCKKEYLG